MFKTWAKINHDILEIRQYQLIHADIYSYQIFRNEKLLSFVREFRDKRNL